MGIEEKRIKATFEADTSKYNSSLQGINKQMKMYQSGVKAASSETSNFGKSSDSLTRQVEGLSKQIDLSKQKIKLYEEAMSKSNTKVQEGVAKRRELELQMSKMQSSYDKVVKAEGANSDQAKILKESLDKLNDEYKKNEKVIESNVKKTADYSTQINNTKTQMSNLQGELVKTNTALKTHTSMWDNASKKLQTFSDKTKKVGDGLNKFGDSVLKVFTPIATGIGFATKSFMEFEKGLTKVNTIADLTEGGLNDLKNGIIDVSKSTGVATSDLNEAMYQALSAGVETGKAVQFLDKAVKMSKGGFTSTTQAVDLLTTAINSYGMSIDDTQKISDIFMQVQNKGKTTIDELSSSMGKIIPTAKGLNVNLEQVGAAMALLTSKGIATAESTTYLNSMMGELGKSGTKTSNKLKELTGMSFNELMSSGKSLSDVLIMLEDDAKKNGKSLADMFGSAEAGRAAMVLATDSGKSYNNMLKEMGNSAGATEKAFKKMMSTKSENLQQGMNKVKLSFMRLGEAAVPIVDEIAGLISKLADFIDGLSEKQLKSIVNFTKWGVIAGGTSKVLGGTVNTVSTLAGGLGKLVGKFGSATTATAGTAKAMGAAASGTSFLTKAITFGTKLVNPYTLAIAGLTVGAVALGKKMKEEVVPSVDVFADSLDKAADGTIKGTIKISDATKEAVGAYLNLDKDVQTAMLNLQFGQAKITDEIAKDMTSKFSNMGKMITTELDKDFQAQLKATDNFFANNKTLTQQEMDDALARLNNYYTNQKKNTEQSIKRINEILDNAAKNNVDVTQKEYDEINRLREGMRDTAIDTLSETEKENIAILGRIKEADGRLTAETAGQHIKELNRVKDKAVGAAEVEYNERIRIAEAIKKDGGKEAELTANKMIKEAKRQRDDTITAAVKTRDDGIDMLSKSYKDLRDDVNIYTGDIKTSWEKWCDWWDTFKIPKKRITVEYDGPTSRPTNSGMGSMSSYRSPAGRSAIKTPDTRGLQASPMSLSRMLPQPQQNISQFDTQKVEKMFDAFTDKINNMNNTINVLINGRELAYQSAGYTNEELERRRIIDQFGWR